MLKNTFMLICKIIDLFFIIFTNFGSVCDLRRYLGIVREQVHPGGFQAGSSLIFYKCAIFASLLKGWTRHNLGTIKECVEKLIELLLDPREGILVQARVALFTFEAKYPRKINSLNLPVKFTFGYFGEKV